ncbi:MAG: tetratricopeptide repeat protein [Anaerolineales bacterium]|nr:tetratricopeptide repeat protein [Anaerolineales bacterium]
MAEVLGRLPLALEHAAAYVLARGSSYGAYHRLFTERQNELWRRAEKPERYHATITTTWELAFDQVKQTPGAMDLLNLCCFLDPEGIPLDLIKQIATVETLHATSLRATVADELALEDALGALRRYSLMQRGASALNRQQNDNVLTLHRLVQAVARLQLGHELAKEWAAAAIELVTSDLPDWHHLHAWEAGPQLLPHMIAAGNFGAAVGLETERLAFLDNWSGFYLKFRGEYRTARPFYERSLALAEKVFGSEHSETAIRLNNLGLLLQAMGDLSAARPFYERALAIYEKALGSDHPDTASSLNNLGALLQAMGDLSAARPYFERALAIREKALGPDHPDTALSLNNLGMLLQASGDLPEARPYLERALAIREKALGPDHPATALSLNNLGALLHASGQSAEAVPYFERAYQIRLAALGDAHPDTAQSIWWLGVIAEESGNLEEAQANYSRAYTIFERALGPNHPTTQQVLSFLNGLNQ